jgi:hypothetical protein
MGGERITGIFNSMLDAHSASTNGLEMLDGAICHFMGSGIATIAQADEHGQAQTATIGAEVMRKAVEADKAGEVHGMAGNWSYRFTAEGVVALTNTEERDSSVVVTVVDLENALAVMAN